MVNRISAAAMLREPIRLVRAALSPGRHAGARVAAGLVLTLLLGCLSFVVGKGIAPVAVAMPASNAWLPTTPRGSATLIDGTSGRPSAEVVLDGAAGHRLRVSQQGDDILVHDENSGTLSRLDSGRLTVDKARPTVPGVQLVAGRSAAYLVDYPAGTAQRIDLKTLQPVGATVRLPGKLGPAGVDRDGTLWVPRADAGVVVPVTAAGPGTAVDVGGKGGDLSVSIVAGRPAVVDRTDASLDIVTRTGVEWSTDLRKPGTPGQPSPLVVPPVNPEPKLPIVDPSGSLVVVDIDSRRTREVRLDPDTARHDLGAPVVNRGRVFVPDFDAGKVLVYSTDRDAWEKSVQVTGKPGRFDTEVKAGAVYLNDPNGPRTVIVSADGKSQSLDKYAPRLPTNKPAKPAPKPRATTPAVPKLPNPAPPVIVAPPVIAAPPPVAPPPAPPPVAPPPAPPSRPGPPVQPQPTKPPPPPPPPPPAPPSSPVARPPAAPPLPPRNVQATPGDGHIDVSWARPVGGGAVRSYQVTWPGGTKTTAGSTTSVRVTGLDCAVEYRFTVVAVGTSGARVSSRQTAPTRPCVPPGQPGGVSAAPQPGGGITVAWNAPPSGGGRLTYEVSYDGGGTRGTVQTAATSVQFGLNPLQFLVRYTFTVRARTPAGESAVSVTARSGGDGQAFTVDVSKTRTDPVNPCKPSAGPCSAAIRQQPTHASAELGRIPQGATTLGFCWRDGQALRNDDGASSTKWILVEYGGIRGFVNTLWLGGVDAWQRDWPCPAGWSP